MSFFVGDPIPSCALQGVIASENQGATMCSVATLLVLRYICHVNNRFRVFCLHLHIKCGDSLACEYGLLIHVCDRITVFSLCDVGM